MSNINAADGIGNEAADVTSTAQKLPPVLSPEEVKRVLTMTTSLKARAMLTLAYGCREFSLCSSLRFWYLRS